MAPETTYRAACALLAEGVHSGRASVHLQLSGNCMDPLICDGDWAAVVGFENGEPQPGQIVVSAGECDRLVCHRVLAVHEGTVWLSGDRVLRVEEHALSDLVGRVDTIERRDETVRIAETRSTAEGLGTWLKLQAWRRQGSLLGRGFAAAWRLFRGGAGPGRVDYRTTSGVRSSVAVVSDEPAIKR